MCVRDRDSAALFIPEEDGEYVTQCMLMPMRT